MTQTQTALFNLAAQQVGGRGRLESTMQASRYNDVFTLWYEPVRDMVFAATKWPSLSRTARLVTYAERGNADWSEGDPRPGFLYTYLQPNDLLRPRAFSTGTRFELGVSGDREVIFADEQNPILHYTGNSQPISRWESALYMAVAYGLAAHTAQTLTGKRQLVADLLTMANDLILTARNDAANMDDNPVSTISTWHQARGLSRAENVVRYIYPDGGMLTVGGSANVK